MLQSAVMSPLLMMKKEMGEMAVRIQRVGISFTSTQNIVKIPMITKMFAKNTTPIKLRFDRLAAWAKVCLKNNNRAATIAPTPRRGN
jgi:hypothetical protein